MKRYLEQLEQQNEELKQKLADLEICCLAKLAIDTKDSMFTDKDKMYKNFEEVKLDLRNMCNINLNEQLCLFAKYQFFHTLGERCPELREEIRKQNPDCKDTLWDDELVK